MVVDLIKNTTFRCVELSYLVDARDMLRKHNKKLSYRLETGRQQRISL